VESFDRVSESLRPLSFGFMMSSRTKLNATSQFRYTFPSESDSSAETGSTLVLPLTFGAGLGYQIDDRYTVAADVLTSLWEKAEINGVSPADLRNGTRFAVGGERSGSRDPLAHWIDRVAYRLGFAYNATYYRPDGDPINEWTVTAGAGIPFSGDARLNLGVEYAHRAGTDRSLITDNIIRVVLSINISEEWFVRPEEE
jgi:long-subunit fatty acid transport protein